MSNNRIQLILFSLNRGAQCDLLLRSLQKNARDLFKVTVLYKASDANYRAGYGKLFGRVTADYNHTEYPDTVFFKEHNFRDDTINNIYEDYVLTAFAVDDDVIYRNIYDYLNYEQIFNDLSWFKSHYCAYSLRIGLDTTVSTYWKQDALPDLTYHESQNVIYWDRMRYPCHCLYNYPLSLDFNIFRTDVIKPLLEQTTWTNPNSLEGALTYKTEKLPKFMAAPRKQCIAAIAVNSVSTWQNPHGKWNPQSPESLNEKYLDNYKIDLDKVCDQLDSECRCSHWEIQYPLCKAN